MKTTSTRFVVDNRSGKWSQKPLELWASLAVSTAAEAAAVLMTETTEAYQANVLDDFPMYQPLHDLLHGDRDEVSILLDRRQLELIDWSTSVLGPDMGPGGRVVGGVATAEILAIKSPCVLAVWHSPASVESEWNGRRADVWRDSFDELHTQVRRARREVGWGAPVFVGGDFNLNFRQPWVRRYVESAWPALELPRMPRRGGSHGDRYIDPVLVANVRQARLRHLPYAVGNDHRGQRLICRVAA